MGARRARAPSFFSLKGPPLCHGDDQGYGGCGADAWTCLQDIKAFLDLMVILPFQQLWGDDGLYGLVDVLKLVCSNGFEGFVGEDWLSVFVWCCLCEPVATPQSLKGFDGLPRAVGLSWRS